MTYKTVFVGEVFGSTLAEKTPGSALTRYAVELAASQGAHLDIGVGVVRIAAPSAIMMGGARTLIAEANAQMRDRARDFAEAARVQAQSSGVTASVEIALDDYHAVARRFIVMARLADVAVMEADPESVSLQEGLLKEVLFDSGRPLIVTPQHWSGPAAPGKVIVAWDGTAKAARAIGVALPLLTQAEEVEVIAVSGDPDPSKRMDAADMAAHLSRHCTRVSMTTLPVQNADVAATISAHAKLTRANLVVMGAYARPKFRQMILGGVTSSMISQPPVPVLLSC